MLASVSSGDPTCARSAEDAADETRRERATGGLTRDPLSRKAGGGGLLNNRYVAIATIRGKTTIDGPCPAHGFAMMDASSCSFAASTSRERALSLTAREEKKTAEVSIELPGHEER